MLYNKEKEKVRLPCDCIVCEHFDKRLKKCTGLGKVCFYYDEKTKVVIDPITGLQIKLK